MALKSILVQGLTAAAVGAPATKDTIDITPKILERQPTIFSETATRKLFSTIAYEVVQGGAKIQFERKRHINKYNTSGGAVTDPNSVGGANNAAPSRIKYQIPTIDTFNFQVNKAWDTGFQYETKKDQKLKETKLINDLASLKRDVMEDQERSYWETLNGDVLKVDKSKSILYPTYVSTIDQKTFASPELVEEFAITPATTLEEKKFLASKVIDTIISKISEIALIGRTGTVTEGYPYARGTKNKIGLKIFIKSSVKILITHDERFIYSGLSAKMVEQGALGSIDGIPVFQDDMCDAISHFDISIVPSGEKGTILLLEEQPSAFVLMPDPYKPTLIELLSGSGRYDNWVTPCINLSKHIFFTPSLATN